MEAAKAGLETFIVKVQAEYFHLLDDAQLTIDFHDTHRLLWRKDLNIAQVTLFSL
jgi:hypothetical protein